MTRTTERTTTGGRADAVSVEEPYWRYRFDASAISARTDTPDLMRVFSGAADASLAEGYEVMADEAAAIHADLAELSLRTWPE